MHMKVSTIRTSRDRRYLGTDLVGSQDSAGGGSGMSGSLGSVLSGAHSVKTLPVESQTSYRSDYKKNAWTTSFHYENYLYYSK